MDSVDPYSLILEPDRNWDTRLFLAAHLGEARRNIAVIRTAKRVKKMIFSKSNLGVQHEFTINEVEDERLILERTVLPVGPESEPNNDLDDNTVEQFITHPLGMKVLEAVRDTIRTIPTPLLVAGASGAIVAPLLMKDSMLPLILIPSLTASISGSAPLSSSQDPLPLMDEGRNSSFMPPPTVASTTVVPQYQYYQKVTMTIAVSLQSIIDSDPARFVSKSLNKPIPPKEAPANDRFVGSDILKHPGYCDETRLDLTFFEPKVMTVYHLAILARVVHLMFPLYSLFKDQCYWFASLIFYAAQIIDWDLAYSRLRPENYPNFGSRMDDFFFPLKLSHSKEAGCWRGIRVTGPKRVVLVAVVERFHKVLGEHIAEVCVAVLSKLLVFSDILSG